MLARINQYGFGSGTAEDETAPSTDDLPKEKLAAILWKTDILFRRLCDGTTASEIQARHEHAFEACDLFLSSLFGNDGSSSSAPALLDTVGAAASAATTGKTPLFHQPLASSCRFPLLPIQADRTLSGVQARGKYNKEKEENDGRSERVGAVRSGFGFFSSMLKTSS